MRKHLIQQVGNILGNGVGNATAPEETRLRTFCRAMQREPEDLFSNAVRAVSDGVSKRIANEVHHVFQSFDRLAKAPQEVIDAAILILGNYPAEDDYAAAA